ncbi:MAG: hypothetical protein RQ824_04765 [bacterium]|nr:hypothetical protein [bacterium]
MKMKNCILIVIVLVMSACGGGGGPSALNIVAPTIGSGGGTATGPAGVVAANPATFNILVNSDIDVPIRYAQIIVTFQPSLMTTIPTVDITSGLFDTIVSASFKNSDPNQGLYILLEDSGGSVTGPGKLCSINFTNTSGAGTQTTTTISFSGSTVVYESSSATQSPLVISSVDVSLG